MYRPRGRGRGTYVQRSSRDQFSDHPDRNRYPFIISLQDSEEPSEDDNPPSPAPHRTPLSKTLSAEKQQQPQPKQLKQPQQQQLNQELQKQTRQANQHKQQELPKQACKTQPKQLQQLQPQQEAEKQVHQAPQQKQNLLQQPKQRQKQVQQQQLLECQLLEDEEQKRVQQDRLQQQEQEHRKEQHRQRAEHLNQRLLQLEQQQAEQQLMHEKEMVQMNLQQQKVKQQQHQLEQLPREPAVHGMRKQVNNSKSSRNAASVGLSPSVNSTPDLRHATEIVSDSQSPQSFDVGAGKSTRRTSPRPAAVSPKQSLELDCKSELSLSNDLQLKSVPSLNSSSSSVNRIPPQSVDESVSSTASSYVIIHTSNEPNTLDSSLPALGDDTLAFSSANPSMPDYDDSVQLSVSDQSVKRTRNKWPSAARMMNRNDDESQQPRRSTRLSRTSHIQHESESSSLSISPTRVASADDVSTPTRDMSRATSASPARVMSQGSVLSVTLPRVASLSPARSTSQADVTTMSVKSVSLARITTRTSVLSSSPVHVTYASSVLTTTPACIMSPAQMTLPSLRVVLTRVDEPERKKRLNTIPVLSSMSMDVSSAALQSHQNPPTIEYFGYSAASSSSTFNSLPLVAMPLCSSYPQIHLKENASVDDFDHVVSAEETTFADVSCDNVSKRSKARMKASGKQKARSKKAQDLLDSVIAAQDDILTSLDTNFFLNADADASLMDIDDYIETRDDVSSLTLEDQDDACDRNMPVLSETTGSPRCISKRVSETSKKQLKKISSSGVDQSLYFVNETPTRVSETELNCTTLLTDCDSLAITGEDCAGNVQSRSVPDGVPRGRSRRRGRMQGKNFVGPSSSTSSSSDLVTSFVGNPEDSRLCTMQSIEAGIANKELCDSIEELAPALTTTVRTTKKGKKSIPSIQDGFPPDVENVPVALKRLPFQLKVKLTKNMLSRNMTETTPSVSTLISDKQTVTLSDATLKSTSPEMLFPLNTATPSSVITLRTLVESVNAVNTPGELAIAATVADVSANDTLIATSSTLVSAVATEAVPSVGIAKSTEMKTNVSLRNNKFPAVIATLRSMTASPNFTASDSRLTKGSLSASSINSNVSLPSSSIVTSTAIVAFSTSASSMFSSSAISPSFVSFSTPFTSTTDFVRSISNITPTSSAAIFTATTVTVETLATTDVATAASTIAALTVPSLAMQTLASGMRSLGATKTVVATSLDSVTLISAVPTSTISNDRIKPSTAALVQSVIPTTAIVRVQSSSPSATSAHKKSTTSKVISPPVTTMHPSLAFSTEVSSAVILKPVDICINSKTVETVTGNTVLNQLMAVSSSKQCVESDALLAAAAFVDKAITLQTVSKEVSDAPSISKVATDVQNVFEAIQVVQSISKPSTPASASKPVLDEIIDKLVANQNVSKPSAPQTVLALTGSVCSASPSISTSVTNESISRPSTPQIVSKTMTNQTVSISQTPQGVSQSSSLGMVSKRVTPQTARKTATIRRSVEQETVTNQTVSISSTSESLDLCSPVESVQKSVVNQTARKTAVSQRSSADPKTVASSKSSQQSTAAAAKTETIKLCGQLVATTIADSVGISKKAGISSSADLVAVKQNAAAPSSKPTGSTTEAGSRPATTAVTTGTPNTAVTTTGSRTGSSPSSVSKSRTTSAEIPKTGRITAALTKSTNTTAAAPKGLTTLAVASKDATTPAAVTKAVSTTTAVTKAASTPAVVSKTSTTTTALAAIGTTSVTTPVMSKVIDVTKPVTPVISKASATSVTSKASATLVTCKVSATPVTSKASTTPVTSRASATSATSKASGTPVTSKASVTPVTSKAAVILVESKASIAPSTSKVPITPVTSKALIAPVASKAAVISGHVKSVTSTKTAASSKQSHSASTTTVVSKVTTSLPCTTTAVAKLVSSVESSMTATKVISTPTTVAVSKHSTSVRATAAASMIAVASTASQGAGSISASSRRKSIDCSTYLARTSSKPAVSTVGSTPQITTKPPVQSYTVSQTVSKSLDHSIISCSASLSGKPRVSFAEAISYCQYDNDLIVNEITPQNSSSESRRVDVITSGSGVLMSAAAHDNAEVIKSSISVSTTAMSTAVLLSTSPAPVMSSKSLTPPRAKVPKLCDALYKSAVGKVDSTFTAWMYNPPAVIQKGQRLEEVGIIEPLVVNYCSIAWEPDIRLDKVKPILTMADCERMQRFNDNLVRVMEQWKTPNKELALSVHRQKPWSDGQITCGRQDSHAKNVMITECTPITKAVTTASGIIQSVGIRSATRPSVIESSSRELAVETPDKVPPSKSDLSIVITTNAIELDDIQSPLLEDIGSPVMAQRDLNPPTKTIPLILKQEVFNTSVTISSIARSEVLQSNEIARDKNCKNIYNVAVVSSPKDSAATSLNNASPADEICSVDPLLSTETDQTNVPLSHFEAPCIVPATSKSADYHNVSGALAINQTPAMLASDAAVLTGVFAQPSSSLNAALSQVVMDDGLLTDGLELFIPHPSLTSLGLSRFPRWKREEFRERRRHRRVHRRKHADSAGERWNRSSISSRGKRHRHHHHPEEEENSDARGRKRSRREHDCDRHRGDMERDSMVKRQRNAERWSRDYIEDDDSWLIIACNDTKAPDYLSTMKVTERGVVNKSQFVKPVVRCAPRQIERKYAAAWNYPRPLGKVLPIGTDAREVTEKRNEDVIYKWPHLSKLSLETQLDSLRFDCPAVKQVSLQVGREWVKSRPLQMLLLNRMRINKYEFMCSTSDNHLAGFISPATNRTYDWSLRKFARCITRVAAKLGYTEKDEEDRKNEGKEDGCVSNCNSAVENMRGNLVSDVNVRMNEVLCDALHWAALTSDELQKNLIIKRNTDSAAVMTPTLKTSSTTWQSQARSNSDQESDVHQHDVKKGVDMHSHEITLGISQVVPAERDDSTLMSSKCAESLVVFDSSDENVMDDDDDEEVRLKVAALRSMHIAASGRRALLEGADCKKRMQRDLDSDLEPDTSEEDAHQDKSVASVVSVKSGSKYRKVEELVVSGACAKSDGKRRRMEEREKVEIDIPVEADCHSNGSSQDRKEGNSGRGSCSPTIKSKVVTVSSKISVTNQGCVVLEKGSSDTEADKCKSVKGKLSDVGAVGGWKKSDSASIERGLSAEKLERKHERRSGSRKKHRKKKHQRHDKQVEDVRTILLSDDKKKAKEKVQQSGRNENEEEDKHNKLLSQNVALKPLKEQATSAEPEGGQYKPVIRTVSTTIVVTVTPSRDVADRSSNGDSTASNVSHRSVKAVPQHEVKYKQPIKDSEFSSSSSATKLARVGGCDENKSIEYRKRSLEEQKPPVVKNGKLADNRKSPVPGVSKSTDDEKAADGKSNRNFDHKPQASDGNSSGQSGEQNQLTSMEFIEKEKVKVLDDIDTIFVTVVTECRSEFNNIVNEGGGVQNDSIDVAAVANRQHLSSLSNRIGTRTVSVESIDRMSTDAESFQRQKSREICEIKQLEPAAVVATPPAVTASATKSIAVTVSVEKSVATSSVIKSIPVALSASSTTVNRIASIDMFTAKTVAQASDNAPKLSQTSAAFSQFKFVPHALPKIFMDTSVDKVVRTKAGSSDSAILTTSAGIVEKDLNIVATSSCAGSIIASGSSTEKTILKDLYNPKLYNPVSVSFGTAAASVPQSSSALTSMIAPAVDKLVGFTSILSSSCAEKATAKATISSSSPLVSFVFNPRPTAPKLVNSFDTRVITSDGASAAITAGTGTVTCELVAASRAGDTPLLAAAASTAGGAAAAFNAARAAAAFNAARAAAATTAAGAAIASTVAVTASTAAGVAAVCTAAGAPSASTAAGAVTACNAVEVAVVSTPTRAKLSNVQQIIATSSVSPSISVTQGGLVATSSQSASCLSSATKCVLSKISEVPLPTTTTSATVVLPSLPQTITTAVIENMSLSTSNLPLTSSQMTMSALPSSVAVACSIAAPLPPSLPSQQAPAAPLPPSFQSQQATTTPLPPPLPSEQAPATPLPPPLPSEQAPATPLPPSLPLQQTTATPSPLPSHQATAASLPPSLQSQQATKTPLPPPLPSQQSTTAPLPAQQATVPLPATLPALMIDDTALFLTPLPSIAAFTVSINSSTALTNTVTASASSTLIAKTTTLPIVPPSTKSLSTILSKTATTSDSITTALSITKTSTVNIVSPPTTMVPMRPTSTTTTTSAPSVATITITAINTIGLLSQATACAFAQSSINARSPFSHPIAQQSPSLITSSFSVTSSSLLPLAGIVAGNSCRFAAITGTTTSVPTSPLNCTRSPSNTSMSPAMVAAMRPFLPTTSSLVSEQKTGPCIVSSTSVSTLCSKSSTPSLVAEVSPMVIHQSPAVSCYSASPLLIALPSAGSTVSVISKSTPSVSFRFVPASTKSSSTSAMTSKLNSAAKTMSSVVASIAPRIRGSQASSDVTLGSTTCASSTSPPLKAQLIMLLSNEQNANESKIIRSKSLVVTPMVSSVGAAALAQIASAYGGESETLTSTAYESSSSSSVTASPSCTVMGSVASRSAVLTAVPRSAALIIASESIISRAASDGIVTTGLGDAVSNAVPSSVSSWTWGSAGPSAIPSATRGNAVPSAVTGIAVSSAPWGIVDLSTASSGVSSATWGSAVSGSMTGTAVSCAAWQPAVSSCIWPGADVLLRATQAQGTATLQSFDSAYPVVPNQCASSVAQGYQQLGDQGKFADYYSYQYYNSSGNVSASYPDFTKPPPIPNQFSVLPVTQTTDSSQMFSVDNAPAASGDQLWNATYFETGPATWPHQQYNNDATYTQPPDSYYANTGDYHSTCMPLSNPLSSVGASVVPVSSTAFYTNGSNAVQSSSAPATLNLSNVSPASNLCAASHSGILLRMPNASVALTSVSASSLNRSNALQESSTREKLMLSTASNLLPPIADRLLRMSNLHTFTHSENPNLVNRPPESQTSSGPRFFAPSMSDRPNPTTDIHEIMNRQRPPNNRVVSSILSSDLSSVLSSGQRLGGINAGVKRPLTPGPSREASPLLGNGNRMLLPSVSFNCDDLDSRSQAQQKLAPMLAAEATNQSKFPRNLAGGNTLHLRTPLNDANRARFARVLLNSPLSQPRCTPFSSTPDMGEFESSSHLNGPPAKRMRPSTLNTNHSRFDSSLIDVNSSAVHQPKFTNALENSGPQMRTPGAIANVRPRIPSLLDITLNDTPPLRNRPPHSLNPHSARMPKELDSQQGRICTRDFSERRPGMVGDSTNGGWAGDERGDGRREVGGGKMGSLLTPVVRREGEKKVQTLVFNRDRNICRNTEECLRHTGYRCFDPYNIRLSRPIPNLECHVLIQQDDVAQIHRLPNLLLLKRDLRVVFYLYKDERDLLECSLTVLFPRAGFLVMDTATLMSCRPDILDTICAYMRKQLTDRGAAWRLALPSNVFNAINTYIRRGCDGATAERLRSILSVIATYRASKTDAIIDLLVSTPSSVTEYQRLCLELQIKHATEYRHFLFITDMARQSVDTRTFTCCGIDVLSVVEFVRCFVSKSIDVENCPKRITEHAPSLTGTKFIDACLSRASETIVI